MKQTLRRWRTNLRYLSARGAIRRWTWYGVGGLLAVWVGWIVVTGLLARNDAAKIRDRLTAVRTAVAQGDLDTARHLAAGIPDLTARAHSLTTGPAWWAAAEVPFLGRPFEITRAATDASNRFGQDGIPALLQVASDLDPSRLRTSGDTVNLAPLEAAAPRLTAAASTLDSAIAELDKAPHASWLRPVDTARASLGTSLKAVSGYVDAAARAARILPRMLGADGPKRYFIGLQNEAEMRGTGGLPGAIAIAVADHGKITFTRFASDQALLPAASGQLVKTGLDFGSQYEAAYGSSGPTSLFVNSNLSPHFPYAAQIWAAMWQKQTGQHIDGAVALDPQVLANFLVATGPVATPAGATISSASVVPLTEQQEYTLFDNNDARRAFLVSVLKTVSTRVINAATDPTALARAMSLSAKEQRVLFWSSDKVVESSIEQTDYAGVIPDSTRPFVGVVLNNTAAGKLDYYLHRSVQYERIGCDSERDMVVTISLRNDAPATGLPDYVEGRLDQADGPTAPGDNRTLLDYYATAGAQLTSVTIDGQRATSAVLQDRGHPVFRLDLELPRTQTRVVVLHLAEPAGSGSVQVWRQPGVYPLDVQGLEQSCS